MSSIAHVEGSGTLATRFSYLDSISACSAEIARTTKITKAEAEARSTKLFAAWRTCPVLNRYVAEDAAVHPYRSSHGAVA
jgi:hypothetical protein